jgi:hypothetical protein
MRHQHHWPHTQCLGDNSELLLLEMSCRNEVMLDMYLSERFYNASCVVQVWWPAKQAGSNLRNHCHGPLLVAEMSLSLTLEQFLLQTKPVRAN